ncbi:MAG TPA: hypothetical protein VNY53_03540 [Bradyrhizobium sp.]|jgi:hypothetical protein|nr:hypothetical protein [Bradyrhizobium sp.]
MALEQLRKRRIIDRRRLFEYVKALVVGGMCPAWVGGIFASDASAAEQNDRLPAFEFLGHHIGDRLQEKFPYLSQDSWTSREEACGDDTLFRCQGDVKGWSRSGYMIADISVELTYGFQNEKLNFVSMFSIDGLFPQKLREMLIGKYGKAYELTFTLNMLLGGGVPVKASYWIFREGFLALLPLAVGGLLIFVPYTVAETSQDDPEAIELRMLGKRTF